MAPGILSDTGGPLFALVTGASGGIGAEISTQLAAIGQRSDGSLVVISGRSSATLALTAEKIKAVAPGVQVIEIVHDMVDCDTLKQKFDLGPVIHGRTFDTAVVVHNHGTLGNIRSLALDADDATEWRLFHDINVTSMVVLNSVVLKQLLSERTKVTGPIFVVQTSTLLALKALPRFHHYCTAKAARDAFMRSVAVENPDKLRVLNYAPGPVETEMYREICHQENGVTHEDTREAFKTAMENGSILQPKQTIEKLMGILNENKFESGAHVDYFDSE